MKSHEWIRGHRKAAGLTQVQLAAKLGVQQSTIVRLESGKHVPLLTTLEKLARVLRVTVVITVHPRKSYTFGPPPPVVVEPPKAKRKASTRAPRQPVAPEQPPAATPLG